MTIELKPKLEKIIREEMESGHFGSPEEVLDSALTAWREKGLASRSRRPRKKLSQFLLESPLAGAELNLERPVDTGRDLRDVIL